VLSETGESEAEKAKGDALIPGGERNNHLIGVFRWVESDLSHLW